MSTNKPQYNFLLVILSVVLFYMTWSPLFAFSDNDDHEDPLIIRLKKKSKYKDHRWHRNSMFEDWKKDRKGQDEWNRIRGDKNDSYEQERAKRQAHWRDKKKKSEKQGKEDKRKGRLDWRDTKVRSKDEWLFKRKITKEDWKKKKHNKKYEKEDRHWEYRDPSD